MPIFFQKLLEIGVISQKDIVSSKDGFYAVTRSIASMLISVGIETFPDDREQLQKCENFFDDWYLYAVPSQAGHTYSLFKMREQEFDAEMGLYADGDTPGVTISFISFRCELLEKCLLDRAFLDRKALGKEIDRVVACRKQKHHPALKAYFIRPEAEGPYLISELYTGFIASLAADGVLNVPKAYLEIYRKRDISKKYARLPDFIDRNNKDADPLVCDHQNIYIKDPDRLSCFEKLAILATHTGNVSFHSFAAEVRFHAMFLIDVAKVRVPFIGSPYASAVRADMSIGDKEFQGPTPYYDLSGRMVSKQKRYHADI